MTKAQKAEKELLDTMEKAYCDKVFDGSIGREMKRLFNHKAREWTPFKMGYFIALLLAAPPGKK